MDVGAGGGGGGGGVRGTLLSHLVLIREMLRFQGLRRTKKFFLHALQGVLIIDCKYPIATVYDIICFSTRVHLAGTNFSGFDLQILLPLAGFYPVGGGGGRS